MAEETPSIVDALPFVDVAIDENEHMRLDAMRMVDEELEVYPPVGDYIEHLPDIKTRPFTTPAIARQLQMLENDGPADTNDQRDKLSCITTDIPTPAHASMDDSELELWKKCLDQLRIKLEYRQRQLTNLELIKLCGVPAWDQFLKHIAQLEASLTLELEQLGERIQEVNSSRKKHQELTMRSLNVLQSEWDNLIIGYKMLTEALAELQKKSVPKSVT